METKGIDLTKCNNLHAKVIAKTIDGKEEFTSIGRIVAEDGEVLLFTDDGGYVDLFSDGRIDKDVIDFEIIPRDSETYMDWQVGDKVCEGEHRYVYYEVIFRSGELVIFKGLNGWASNPMTCSEAFTRFGMRLVLTCIERQIIEEKKKYEPKDGDVCFVRTAAGNCFIFIKRGGDDEYGLYKYASIDTNSSYLCPAKVKYVCRKEDIRELRPATEEEKQRLFDAMARNGKRWNAEKKVVEYIPEPYEFKYGEPVLVRNGPFEKWCIAAYCQPEGTTNRVFVGEAEAYFVEVIPYNERTMHLLGTTEDYKEE